MIKLRQAIVVEGRYDKNALCQLVDAPVIETHGFGVMKDKRLLGFLRQVAAARGLIVLTDSDGAGFVIRNFLKGALPPEQVLHAYIPDVPRQGAPQARPRQGGQARRGGHAAGGAARRRCGGPGHRRRTRRSRRIRSRKRTCISPGFPAARTARRAARALQQELGLPEHLGSAGLLQALNLLMTREEFQHRYGELR